MKQNKGYGLIIVIIVTLMVLSLGGYFLLNKSNIFKGEVDNYNQNQTETFKMNNEETGETEDSPMEKSEEDEVTQKPVSDDNSFTSIEKDLDSTVILEEDFSDL